MIGYVRGIITHRLGDSCFVDVQGVGYQVFLSQALLHELVEGEERTLYTYMHVREDAILLYGFQSLEEQSLFLSLISVSGIGPKVALGILSSMTPAACIAAILQGNVVALTKLPGIGKKTAERLVLELKDKVSKLSISPAATAPPEQIDVAEASGVAADVMAALVGLGYREGEIASVMEGLDIEGMDETTALRTVLKALGKER